MTFLLRVLLCCVLLVLVASSVQVLAQPTPPAEQPTTTVPAEETANERGFLDLLFAGGAIGWLILAMSVGVVALVIEQALLLRANVICPTDLAGRVQELLRQGQLAQAIQLCKTQPSPLSEVLQAGLAELDLGWPTAEKAMQDRLADVSGKLFRRLDYFSAIGNVAPMLGLLGTVVGIMLGFQAFAEAEGVARAAALADGIYLALVTTVEGLIVAVPALVAYLLFRNRAADLVGQVATTADGVFAPLRRKRSSARPTTIEPPPRT